MIKILNKNKLEPYLFFYNLLDNAKNKKQEPINAICISSFNKNIKAATSPLANVYIEKVLKRLLEKVFVIKDINLFFMNPNLFTR